MAVDPSLEARKAKMAERLAKMRAAYLDELPDALEIIQRLTIELTEDGWKLGTAKSLRAEIHRMAGSAGLYGLSDVSEHATETEEQLARHLRDPDFDDSAAPDADELAAISRQVEALAQCAKAHLTGT